MLSRWYDRDGFGVTYEGLKRRLPVREILQNRGFGVTYEGLKPGTEGPSLCRVGGVLELPMRV